MFNAANEPLLAQILAAAQPLPADTGDYALEVKRVSGLAQGVTEVTNICAGLRTGGYTILAAFANHRTQPTLVGVIAKI